MHRTTVVRSRAAWTDSPWRIAGTALAVVVGTLLAMIIVALFVIPRVSGGQSLTVLSGSMEPALQPGDVVVVRGIDQDDVCTDIGVGDIITYLPNPNDPTLITHRAVGKTIGTFEDGTDCRVITQGDANSAVDDPVSPVQVRGVFLYGIPKLGWVRQWAADNTMLLLIAAVVVIGLALLWDQLRPRRTRVITAPAAASAQTAHASPPEPARPDDHELRLRELAIREREVAVREAELAERAAERELVPPGALRRDRRTQDD